MSNTTSNRSRASEKGEEGEEDTIRKLLKFPNAHQTAVITWLAVRPRETHPEPLLTALAAPAHHEAVPTRGGGCGLVSACGGLGKKHK